MTLENTTAPTYIQITLCEHQYCKYVRLQYNRHIQWYICPCIHSALLHQEYIYVYTYILHSWLHTLTWLITWSWKHRLGVQSVNGWHNVRTWEEVLHSPCGGQGSGNAQLLRRARGLEHELQSELGQSEVISDWGCRERRQKWYAVSVQQPAHYLSYETKDKTPVAGHDSESPMWSAEVFSLIFPSTGAGAVALGHKLIPRIREPYRNECWALNAVVYADDIAAKSFSDTIWGVPTEITYTWGIKLITRDRVRPITAHKRVLLLIHS